MVKFTSKQQAENTDFRKIQKKMKGRGLMSKTCAFYASDYHFEMISLPYIENRLRRDKKVFILTENNLEKTMKTLVQHINLSDKKKENILNLKWDNNNEEKLETIKENIEKGEDVVIFVKGKLKYIEKANKDIEKIDKKRGNIKIIDCYNIEEVGKTMDNIVDKYEKVLSTTGEKVIENKEKSGKI